MSIRRALILIAMLLLTGATLLPALAQTEGRIAYASNNDGDFDIYVMNADGSDPVQLTYNDSDDLAPAWSPDGRWIAYASNLDGDWDIYVMDADGGKLINLTADSNEGDLYPAWSPDGEWIAFTSSRDGNWDIYRMDTSGRDVTRLTQSDEYAGNPTWSPDSQQIAFVTGREDTRDLVIMNADGSGQQSLISNSTADYSPAWSPVEASPALAFISEQDGDPRLYVVALECLQSGDCAGSARPLNTRSDGDYDPAWSSDGAALVVAATVSGNIDLYRVDADGNITRLTNSVGDDRFPAWWAPRR